MDPVTGKLIGVPMAERLPDRKDNIFLQELDAAIRALVQYDQGKSTRAEYIIVTDNAGVAGVLRKGVSTSSAANLMLCDLPEHIFLNLTVVSVKSGDNPADVPSREGRHFFDRMNANQAKAWHGRMQRCFREVQLALAGEGFRNDPKQHTKPFGVRHPEGDADEPADMSFAASQHAAMEKADE